MTPQEKASDLVNRFYDKIEDVESVDDRGWSSNSRLLDYSVKLASKQCALIAVDELIESFNSIYDASIRNIEKYSGAKYGMRDYWEEVKKEIENL